MIPTLGDYEINVKDPQVNRFHSKTCIKLAREICIEFKDLAEMKSVLLNKMNEDFGEKVYHCTVGACKRSIYIYLECIFKDCPFQLWYTYNKVQ